jgi:hypothetical protein
MYFSKSQIVPGVTPTGFPSVSHFTAHALKENRKNKVVPQDKARETARALAVAFCTPSGDKSKGFQAFNALCNLCGPKI